MVRRPLWPSAVLLGVGVLALLLGGLALYARHTVLDARSFAARGTSALGQDEVRDEIVTRIAQREMRAQPELIPRRAVLDTAAADLVDSARFAGEFRAGMLGLHRTLFEGRGQPALALPGGRSDLAAAVDDRAPGLGRRLAPGTLELMRLGGGRLETSLRQAAPAGRRLSALWAAALGVGALALIVAVLRAPTRRRGLRHAALAVALAGGAAVAGTAIARALVLATFDTSHGDAVVSTIWGAYLGDLRLWGLAVGALGLILAAAVEPGPSGAASRLVRRAVSPAAPGVRLVRAAVLAVLAALLLVAPEVPLDLALVAGAGLLVFTAAAEVVRVAGGRARPQPAD